MNVLILAQYFPPDMGGGATRAHNIAKGLSAAGCQVTVVTAFPHYPSGNIPTKYAKRLLAIEYDGSLRIIRTFVPRIASEGLIKRMLLFVSFAFSSFFALPISRKIDIVWAANPNIIAVYPGLVFSRISNCPVVQNVDDLWPEVLYELGLPEKSFFAKLAKVFAKTAYTVSNFVTPISPGYLKTICGEYGVDPQKVKVVRGGVDLSIFKMKDRSTKSSGKKFRVLYSGAFSPAYDFDQVLLAAKELSSDPDVEFVLQGSGELVFSLKSKIKDLKIENVKVIDRIFSRAEVADLLCDADALLLPLRDFGSPYQGISSKLYEYQAVGKPIICCGDGQPAKYVSDTDSGKVVKPGDYQALAKAVLCLKGDAFVARKLGLAGRRYVEKNLAVEFVGQKMLSAFLIAKQRIDRK